MPYAQRESMAYGMVAFDSKRRSARPGVVVLHEAFGLREHVGYRIARLAELGFIALAADIFGERKIPNDREEASQLAGKLASDPDLIVDRVGAAVGALREHPLADDPRIAVIGYCMGGTFALEYGRSKAAVRGVACFHGRLTTTRPLSDATGAPPFLVCTGAEDPLVPGEHRAAFTDEMSAARADWQMSIYGGAGHAFTDVNAASLGVLGVAHHPRADRRSWQQLRCFLDEVF